MGTNAKNKEKKTMIDHTPVRPAVDDRPFTLKTTLDNRATTPTAAKRRAEDEPTIEMTAAELQELLPANRRYKRVKRWPSGRDADPFTWTRVGGRFLAWHSQIVLISQ